MRTALSSLQGESQPATMSQPFGLLPRKRESPMGQENYPDSNPFTDQPPAAPPSIALTSDERMWGMFCHLSPLLSYVAAGMTFIGPLVCWLIKKDTSKFVDLNGKESLNFQICILIYSLICFPLFCVGGFGVFLLAAVQTFNVVCCIIAGIKANGGELFRYPFIFRLIN